MGALRLRPLRPDDEPAFAAADRALAADDFVFGLGYDDATDWAGYLESLDHQRRAIDVPAHLVPATFLVADVDGTIVGRTSIRHELNDFLAREGGHIGYGVLPDHRRRGYATELLRQSLVIARSLDIQRVLVVCDEDNIGSATAIERCGGVLEPGPAQGDDGRPIRRYWIT